MQDPVFYFFLNFSGALVFSWLLVDHDIVATHVENFSLIFIPKSFASPELDSGVHSLCAVCNLGE